MDVLTSPSVAPLPATETAITPSPVQPITPPAAVEVVGGGQRALQQISEAQREQLLVDDHIASETSWWLVYDNRPDSTAFGRARLREQRTAVAS